jgi:hypothetical protein
MEFTAAIAHCWYSVPYQLPVRELQSAHKV